MVDPWDDIPRAASPGAMVVRLADPDHALEFSRGRDFNGRHVFLLQVEWPGGEPTKAPAFSGVDVKCEAESDRCTLSLTLLDRAKLDVFRPLCANLMHTTR